MPAVFSPSLRFARTIRRRLIATRAAEAAGVGLLAACGVVVLTRLLTRPGQTSLELALAWAAVGIIAGIAWAIIRRPSLLWAAILVDQQLDWQDLLGAAVSCGSTPDAWGRAVVAQADARVADVTPGAVKLHRWGVRAWSGVALACVTTMVVASAPGWGSRTVERRMVAQVPFEVLPAVDPVERREDASRGATAPRPAAALHGDRENDERRFDDSQSTDTQDTRSADPSGPSDASPDHDSSNASGAGAASGRAQTRPPAGVATHARDDSSAGSRDNTERRDTAGGAPKLASAGGGGSASADDAHAGAGESPIAGASSATAGAPPVWSSASWPAAQQAADRTLASGQIPAGYRDLVRDYFERR